jgi:lambda family phage portal protein
MRISAAQHEEAIAYLGKLGQAAQTRSMEQAIQAALLEQSNEAFRYGRRDNRTRNFDPPGRNGMSATLESDELMHRRVRSEDLNNAQVKRIVDAFADLIVGTGMQTFADPFSAEYSLSDLNTGLDGELSYALEADDVFTEWFNDPKQFDATGKQSGPEIQRQLIAETARVGDCFLLKVMKPRRNRTVGLAFQIIERDQLNRELDRPASDGVNKIAGGIETNAAGEIVAYHFYDEHPFDDLGTGQGYAAAKPIPADRVLHLNLLRRPSDCLSYSWLHACGQALFDRDKFMGAEIQSAAKAALLLLIHKMADPRNKGTLGLLDDDDTSDLYGNPRCKLGSTPLAMQVGKEDDVKLVEAVRPNNQAESFMSILDHDTSGAVGLSYYTLTGRYDQTSFTSVRGALLAEDSHMKPLQAWFATRIALPIRSEFHRQALALDLMNHVSLSDYLDEPRKFGRFLAIGAGRDLLQPAEEIEAACAKIRSGQSTLQIECAKRGLHWIRVLLQLSREQRLAKKFGVELDFSKGNGGKAGDADDNAKPQPKKGASR